MTAPERIYRDETGLWSRNTAAFSTFSEVRVSPTGVEYIRADIHEAEIDALKAEISHLCAEAFQSDLDALKVANQQLMDEMAALKMPPKILKAEEVAQAGYYWWRGEYKEWEPVRVDIDEFGVDVWRIMTEIPAYDGEWGKPYGEFIGPLKATEVTNT